MISRTLPRPQPGQRAELRSPLGAADQHPRRQSSDCDCRRSPAGDGITASSPLPRRHRGGCRRGGRGSLRGHRFRARTGCVLCEPVLPGSPPLFGRDSCPGRPGSLSPARRSLGVLPLQFALAGMNAAGNRELCRLGSGRRTSAEASRSVVVRRSTALRQIDALLARREECSRGLVTGFAGEIDIALGHVDDVLAMGRSSAPRAAAWVHAETLSALRVPAQRSTS